MLCGGYRNTVSSSLVRTVGEATVGWHLNDLTLATGSPVGGWRPSGYVFEAQRTQHVTYVGTDYHIHELWWDGNGWHHDDLTNAAGAPTASNAGGGYIFRCTRHVPYLTDAFPVGELWWDNHGWHYTDLAQAAGIAVTGAAAGYAFPAQGTQHVNFPDVYGHIHELWWDGNGWYHNDLTDATGAPLSSANPTGYVFPAQGTQHVTYAGTDGHVYELWWDGNGWHYNNLTAAAGAPLAQGNRNASGYVFPSQGTQHVNYLGLDNHIHELWWDNNGWHHNDLTAITASPESTAAGPEPVGYVFSGTRHVNYLGADNHIQELWWDSSGWHHNDLTSAAGAAATVYAQPRGYAFETQGTQHVIYMDDNGHVVELYWTP